MSICSSSFAKISSSLQLIYLTDKPGFLFQRKLQRCIKHISDKHRIEMNLDIPEEVGPPSPQSSQSPPTTTTYSPSLDNAAAGPSEDVKDNTIPLEDDLFFVSYAGMPCDVDKCLTDGLHYHCKRCPFVTKQVTL